MKHIAKVKLLPAGKGKYDVWLTPYDNDDDGDRLRIARVVKTYWESPRGPRWDIRWENGDDTQYMDTIAEVVELIYRRLHNALATKMGPRAKPRPAKRQCGRQCSITNCFMRATSGWTTCAKHHSAGKCRKQARHHPTAAEQTIDAIE